ncbi:hypothetical protein HK100_002749 [Physocladia obscura]|uniref:Endoplasmic reticulum transmembrane protein n=1 Tax=Physocladia obscura TaxID=109957 RepID=A0AAD5SXQ6_9FUNG|nr:hypothetical protein HK100_002749 [Physocladia obscura]
MKIFNSQLTYVVLIGEIATYLVLLIPMTFIPVRARKSAMQFGGRILSNESVVWVSRIIFLLVASVFADTLLRLQRLDSELHSRDSDSSHHHHDSPLEEIQFKSKLFYSQRNMYLSLMSLFMIIVVYRRVKDIYLILHLQDSQDSDSVTIKALKQQVEVLIAADTKAPSLSEKKSEAPSAAQKSEAAQEIQRSTVEDPSDVAGIRKRK